MLLGVNDLNAERVMHRDIKPENILVQGERGLILIDFGCARLIPEKMGNVIKRGLLSWDDSLYGSGNSVLS